MNIEERKTEATDGLATPYGGQLIDLLVPDTERAGLRQYANTLPSVQLTERATCDLELLAVGAFSPLDRFMGADDLEACLESMKLASGHIFPIPVTLGVNVGQTLEIGQDIALRDTKNLILAVMTVEEVYEWNSTRYCEKVLGTLDLRHPLVAESQNWGSRNISGRLRVLELPRHYDFADLRLTPAEVRARLDLPGGGSVVAFHTRNPMHRAHEEMAKQAMARTKGKLLIHPVIGMTKPGDVDYMTRVRTYKSLVDNYFDEADTVLALIPLAMRMAGPREALWHMLIRRNYGVDHFVIGRDHASPGNDSDGNPFYEPAAACKLADEFSAELGVKPVSFDEFLYLPDSDSYVEAAEGKRFEMAVSLSGTRARDEYLGRGIMLPSWFARPEVAEILNKTYPPKIEQGVCLWFTGLSGAGKSTIAEILTVLLMERGRRVTLLDGDVVRTHLSKGLGFDKESRDTNILRIGFVASEIVRHGGVAICAAVSPYRAARNSVRNMFEAGKFFEVFVDTPLAVCEQRDSKGMYEKARRGEIKGFTGIDDPYERPESAEIVIDSPVASAEENARSILDRLAESGLICE